MTTKPTRGGTRQGSGRPPKYGEPTVKIQITVPASYEQKFRIMISNLQNQWKNDTANYRSS